MALYALKEDDLISAWDADKKTVYRCLECFQAVKVRRGRRRFPHFYHITSSPSCRLYSKSEDHLLLQLQVQRLLPKGEASLEKPLLTINRVADVLWEQRRLVFEIQCSLLSEAEARSRTLEYKTAGYDIIWILDDRIFNRRQLRPAEFFLRRHSCYFASVQRSSPSYIYDQFEIFHGQKRIKKGRKIPIDLTTPYPLQAPEWPKELPEQIEQRIQNTLWFFRKDLIHRALLSQKFPSFKRHLQYWRMLEIHLKHPPHSLYWVRKALKLFIGTPYLALLDFLLEKVNA